MYYSMQITNLPTNFILTLTSINQLFTFFVHYNLTLDLRTKNAFPKYANLLLVQHYQKELKLIVFIYKI